MNTVNLQGIIRNIYTGERVTIMTLRIRESGRYQEINFPEVCFRGKMRNIAKNFNEGNFVTITGCVKSLKKYNQKTGKNEWFTSIEAKTIFYAQNAMTRVFAGEFEAPSEYKNDVYIQGTLLHIKKRTTLDGKPFVGVLVRPDGCDYNVYCFDYGNVEKWENMKKDDIVCLRCLFATRRHEREGEVVFSKKLIVRNAGLAAEPIEFINDEAI